MARSLRKTFSTATGTGRTTGAFRASHSQFRQLPRLVSARWRRARRGSNSECTRRRSPDWYTAQRHESVYGFKTLVEEVINLFGLAIRHGLTTKDLNTTIFAYPTGASDIGIWCSFLRESHRSKEAGYGHDLSTNRELRDDRRHAYRGAGRDRRLNRLALRATFRQPKRLCRDPGRREGRALQDCACRR